MGILNDQRLYNQLRFHVTCRLDFIKHNRDGSLQ